MKKSILTIVLLGLAGAGAAIPKQTAQQPRQFNKGDFFKGDYVEARTASVFAGACHYNSELMTCGRDAVMAWNITDGNWNKTSLAGVRAMAVVSSDENLSDDTAARKTEVVVDSSNDAQAAAVVAAIKADCGTALGDVVSVRRGAVSFADNDRQYSVAAAGFARISTQAMPNDECCKMPNMVWYSPLTPLENRKVGFTKDAAYVRGTLGDTWDRQQENSAFYGQFAFLLPTVHSAEPVVAVSDQH